MNRKTLTAIAAFAVLGLIALFALRQPEKGESATDRARPIAKLNPGDVDTLQLTRGGATATLKKDGPRYKVTAPVPYAADEPAAKAAFDAVEKLEFSDLVSEQKAKQAEFEVDDAKGVHVVAKSEKNGGKVLADLIIGKAMGNGTMVRPAGKDQVWQASGNLRGAFDKAVVDWRDKSVLTFTPTDAELLTIKAKDGSSVIVKRTGAKEGAGPDDKWDLVTSTVKLDKLDNSVPAGIVAALSTLKTNDFADAARPAESGLDAPALTLTVSLKGGKTTSLLVGNKKGEEDFYVQAAGNPQVFVLKKFNIERINKRPVEFKDKTLCDIPEGELAEIAVTHGENSFTVVKAGAAWKATKPAKLDLDQGKMGPLAGAFKEWKATGIAEDPTPAATGLAKPKAVIAAKSKTPKGPSCVLKIGDETKDKQSYFVQAAKGPDVYVVAKWTADRILLKTDDLKKATVAKQ